MVQTFDLTLTTSEAEKKWQRKTKTRKCAVVYYQLNMRGKACTEVCTFKRQHVVTITQRLGRWFLRDSDNVLDYYCVFLLRVNGTCVWYGEYTLPTLWSVLIYQTQNVKLLPLHRNTTNIHAYTQKHIHTSLLRTWRYTWTLRDASAVCVHSIFFFSPIISLGMVVQSVQLGCAKCPMPIERVRMSS